MTKVVSFAGFDTLFDDSKFYEAIGRVGRRYAKDEELTQITFRKLEQQLMNGEYLKYSKLIEEALNQTGAELGFEVAPSDFSDVLIAHTVIKPFPDAPTALYQIKHKGYQTVLLTNHSRDLIGSNMVELDHNFDLVVTSEDMEAYKPSTTYFDYVQAQLGEVTDHIHIAVNDTKDLKPAEKMGWQTIQIDRNDENTTLATSLMDTVERV